MYYVLREMVQFQWNGLISSIYFQIIKMKKELSGRKLKQTTFWHENNIPRNKTTNLIAVTFFSNTKFDMQSWKEMFTGILY